MQMRHLYVVVDGSRTMEDQDLKPNRLTCTLKVFLHCFFLLSHRFCKLVAFCISKNCNLLYVPSLISHTCICLLASVASLSLSCFLNSKIWVALFCLAHVLLYSKNTLYGHIMGRHIWKLCEN